MDILLAILAVLGFVAGVASLAIALHTHYAVKAQIITELDAVKVDTIGMESRLDRLMDKRLNERFLDVSATIKNETFDIVQTAMQREADIHASPLDMARFSTLGD